MINIIKQVLSPVASKLFSRARLMDGQLKGTDVPFRCLFIGNSDFTKYLKIRMYEDKPVVRKNYRLWLPSLKSRILKNEDAFDLCVAVLPAEYETTFKGLYDYKSTELVRQVIDTSGTWEEVRSNLSRRKRTIVNNIPNKYGFEYRVSNDIRDFEIFYHRMFLPHISKRFGDLSEIEPYEEMKEYFLKGFLLLVTKNGEALAGSLCHIEDGVLLFRRVGVLDGDDTHIEGGAQMALYYFQLKYAQENALRAVDMMMSAPFLNDGVYRNKREWGATVFPEDEGRRVFFFTAGPPDKLARFFENNPAIVHTDDGLKGVVGLPDAADIPTEMIDAVTRKYQTRGLTGFLIQTNTGILNVS